MSTGPEPTSVEDIEPRPDRDWPAQAADSVVDVVDRVRDQTTTRAMVAARGLVFGLPITVLGLVFLVSFVVLLLRGTQVFLVEVAGLEQARAVYVSYLAMGGVLSIVGFWLWRRANNRARKMVDVDAA